MADEELKVLLRENIEVSKESLKILKKMNRARIFGGVFKFFKWGFIIGVSVWGYLQLQPFVQQYLDLMRKMSSGVENIGKIGNNINSAVSPNLLEKLQDLMPR